MRNISAYLPERDIQLLDNLIADKKYMSRSDAIRQAIRLLRDYESGRYTVAGPQPQTLRPVFERFTIQAQGYFLPDSNGEELQQALMNEIKQKQIEMGLRAAEPVFQTEYGECDPLRCKYPIMKKGKITQCPNFKIDNEDYCLEHLK